MSNINRDDILVYTRNLSYRQNLLEEVYWPYYYEIKNLVFVHGVEICDAVESSFGAKESLEKEKAVKVAKNLIALIEKDLEDISPGNLQEK